MTPAPPAAGRTSPGRPLLLFDGVCSLCDGTVQFVMARDDDEQILFASLQSALATDHLRRAGLRPGYLDSLVFIDEHGEAWVGADAALGVGRRLRAPWRQMAVAARWVPRPLREATYRWIAERRYALFGTREACRVPSPAERARFLG